MSEAASNEVEKPSKSPRKRTKRQELSTPPVENQSLSENDLATSNLKLVRIVVQLNRFAMKYIDLKGTIANNFFSNENQVTFSYEPTLTQIPSLSERIRIINKDKKRTIYVGFESFVYERKDLTSDLRFLAHEIAKWAKDIDQDILNVQNYDRWGVRVFYQLNSKKFSTFIMRNFLKLEQDQIDSYNGKFDANALELRFTGTLKEEQLNYFFNITNLAQEMDNDATVSPSDKLTFDLDLFRNNVKGLNQLQETIQSSLTLSENLITQFLDEVLNWQK